VQRSCRTDPLKDLPTTGGAELATCSCWPPAHRCMSGRADIGPGQVPPDRDPLQYGVNRGGLAHPHRGMSGTEEYDRVRVTTRAGIRRAAEGRKAGTTGSRAARLRGWNPDGVTISESGARPERTCDLPGCINPAPYAVNDWIHTTENPSPVGPDLAVFCSHQHHVEWNRTMLPDIYGPDRVGGRGESPDYPRNPR
jgi:hypothetical protein